MASFPIHSSNLRVLSPEVVWLEPEHFDRAQVFSQPILDEAQQWQAYLDVLALLGLEEWLNDRGFHCTLHRNSETFHYLDINGFKLCPVATEHVLDEVMSVPRILLDRPNLACHFYVALEVVEEQAQIVIRGILRYDQLTNYCTQANLPSSSPNDYPLPLSIFDPEPNHLLTYIHALYPETIPLPATDMILQGLEQTRTCLSQWLQNIFEESWQTIEGLLQSDTQLAFSTRNITLGTQRGRLINLGLQLREQSLALLVQVLPEQEKLNVCVQLHPTQGAQYLPPNLKLTLRSKAGKPLQEVTARSQDNYIQLPSIKGEVGKRFSLEVSLDEVYYREDFEF